jgi:hypothetical protein
LAGWRADAMVGGASWITRQPRSSSRARWQCCSWSSPTPSC